MVLERRGEDLPLLVIVLKSKFGWVFSQGEFTWEVCGTFLKIVINLPRTYEKLQCKGEPY